MNKKMIRLVAMALSAVLLLCACGGSSSNESVELNVPTFEDDKSITIGTWSGSMSNWTSEEFTNLKNANINLLVGVSDYVSFTDRFFDDAQAAGVSVIPNSRSWDGEVPEYVDHPAFMGFCVYDEPTDEDFDLLAEKKTLWDGTMGEKLFFVNLFPGDIGSTQFGGYENYISGFVNTVKPAVLSFDHYCLMTDSNGNTVVKDSFFNNMDVCSYYAKQAGIPFWFSLLTAKHLNYVEPTAKEIGWQMAVGQAYGATGLVHYVYASHDPDYTCPIDWKTQTTTELYNSMAAANAEVASWDHIYMNYNWQGTATVGGSDNAVDNVGFMFCAHAVDPTENSGITAIESGEDLLCGIFKDDSGNMAYMLTNATNPAEDKNTTVKLTLDEKYKGVLIIADGQQKVVKLEENTATIEIPSGEGQFVIPLTAK